MANTIKLQAEPFDPGQETNLFLQECEGAGAAVTFTGLVRSTTDNPIESLTLEHYPALVHAQLTKLADQASDRFDLLRLTIIHRFGKMFPGEPIVQVMALSPHRQAAFDGANFVMDILKTDAPFWKKEQKDGVSAWVDATDKDNAARDRWAKPKDRSSD